MRSFRYLLATLLSTSAMVGTACADGYPPPVPYAPQLVDAVHVDLLSRLPTFTVPDVAIGGGLGLAHSINSANGAFVPHLMADSFIGGISYSSSCSMSVGNGTEGGCFQLTNGVYIPTKGDGSTLVANSATQYAYTDRQGTTYLLDASRYASGYYANMGIVTSVRSPTGLVQRFTWEVYSNLFARLKSVSTNTGFAVKYEYKTDTYDATSVYRGENWNTVASVTAYNRARQMCSDAAAHCANLTKYRRATYNFQSLGAYAGYNLDIVDASQNVTSFGLDPTYRISSFRAANEQTARTRFINCRSAVPPGVPQASLGNYGDPCYVYYGEGVLLGSGVTTGVKWVERDGVKWIYSPAMSIGGCSCYFANSGRRPDGGGWRSLLYQTTFSSGWLIKADTADSSWAFEPGYANRVTAFTKSGFGTTTYSYDARGNVTQAVMSATGLADRVVKAVYPAACSGNVTCNKATAVTDPNGKTTDYTYDPVHGGILTETGPADANGVRPQKRYQYTQRSAVYLNDSGVLAQDPAPVWLVSRESVCATSAWTGTACAAGPDDEVVTTYDYGPTSGANNLLLRGIAVTARNVTLRTCYSYDEFGDKVGETRPSANLASCS